MSPLRWPSRKPTAVSPGGFSNATPLGAAAIIPPGAKNWYAVTHSPVPATPIVTKATCHSDALIRAEKHRRNFVQTLTEEPLPLSIGLAILIQKNQLVPV